MKTRDWAALLVGIAGAAATLAAIPATNYRLAVIIVAALLIVIALAIAAYFRVALPSPALKS